MKRRVLLLAAIGTSALLFPTLALASECLVDLNGFAISGSICCHQAIPLSLGDINLSTWSSAYAYDAVRTDSSNTVTYDVAYSSGGDHSYGTSGNTSRKTWFDLDISGTANSWGETESQIC